MSPHMVYNIHVCDVNVESTALTLDMFEMICKLNVSSGSMENCTGSTFNYFCPVGRFHFLEKQLKC